MLRLRPRLRWRPRRRHREKTWREKRATGLPAGAAGAAAAVGGFGSWRNSLLNFGIGNVGWGGNGVRKGKRE